ncbi:MAG: hypothetical protein ACI97A_000973 [Planctomycetota bacterium]
MAQRQEIEPEFFERRDSMTMSADEFRDLALGLPEVVESAHNKHPDFRLGGKVLATIGPDAKSGMVNLTPAQQEEIIEAEPRAYESFNGAWGKRGCTKIIFEHVLPATALSCLTQAWLKTALATLHKRYPDLYE